MAFIVARQPGRFEIRESQSTRKGPRSRTLASFSELNDDVIARARAKASKPPVPDELRRAARRIGAPVAPKPAERAARQLIAELAKGQRLDPRLLRVLHDLLERDDGPAPSVAREAGRSIAEWLAATPIERGNALVDLLLLADALPAPRRVDEPLRFPRLDSSVR
jgi:hypothetical protein